LRLPHAMVEKWNYLQAIQTQSSLRAEEVTKKIKSLPLPEHEAARDLLVSMRHVSLPNLWRLHFLLKDSVTPHRQVLKRWAFEQTKDGRALAGGMRNLIQWRNDLYHKWARSLCLRFSAIDMEDLSLKKMAEGKEKDYRIERSMEMRQLVAPYSLTLAITHMASKIGTEIRKHNPAYSTLTCPVCKERLPENTGEIILVCPKGHAYDQDAGASITIQAPERLAK